MNQVSEGFLLGLAGMSATLLGTFIVGVFFYIDSDLHRRLAGTEAVDIYLRSATRWVFAAYSIPLLVPLALVALEPLWGAMTFAVLGGILSLLTIDTGRRLVTTGRSGMSRALVINEWMTSAAVLAAVILPWALDGWIPRAGEFAPSLILLLASGFESTAALVLAQFDATKGLHGRERESRVPPGEASEDQRACLGHTHRIVVAPIAAVDPTGARFGAESLDAIQADPGESAASR